MAITKDLRWKNKWRDSIWFTYKRARYFNEYFVQIETLLKEEPVHLSQFNISLIKLLCKLLGIRVDFILASQLDVCGKASDLILGICKKLNASTYISGVSGKEYLALPDFARGKIEVLFQEFHHPIYEQLYEPFIPCLSVIDLLFNYGDQSLSIIKGEGVPVMDTIFIRIKI